MKSAGYRLDINKPSKYDDRVEYPDKVRNFKDANDRQSLFLEVDAKFDKSTDKPR